MQPGIETVQDALHIKISPDFFADLIAMKDFKQVLVDLDIAEEEHFSLFDTLDVDGGGSIDIEELLTGLEKLRGEPRRSDIIAIRLVVRDIQDRMQRLEVHGEKM